MQQTKTENGIKMPELLAPAGGRAALEAAIEAGADAVYFGADLFSARASAENFAGEDLRRAVELCRAYGVKSNITMNTLVLDRELSEWLSRAAALYEYGADALIVADLGAAAELKRQIPDICLHASTQCSAHSAAGARALAALGFDRVVVARELSREEIAAAVRDSGCEIEMFLHGALCVSHSGQCLFSSIVGGRSGNRGECAQPCRLPYDNGKYPLSLSDNCLAGHINEILELGVASLKIEGRLKSPEYVYAVTSVYRRLLDERRDANAADIEALARAFSRGGFTDGYFTGKIDSSMLGVRSDADKAASREAVPFAGLTKKIPITLDATLEVGKPSRLTVKCGERSFTATGASPEAAKTAPLSFERVKESLLKLGNTPYSVSDGDFTLSLGENLIMRISDLNALRRDAISALSPAAREHIEVKAPIPTPGHGKARLLTAEFRDKRQFLGAAGASIFFDIVFLPPDEYTASANGVVFPAVILGSEEEAVCASLSRAKSLGAKHALIHGVGQIELARKFGFIPHASTRFNVTNSASAALLFSLGIESVILSPELTLPQMRDIGGATRPVVYGRLPLMLLEKCVAKEIASCDICKRDGAALTDRTNTRFPVLREPPHRNVVYNSLPTYMGDRRGVIERAGIHGGHFIFTVESPEGASDAIKKYDLGQPFAGYIRRIKE